MEKISCRLAVYGFFLALILQSNDAQKVHIVGDSVGWTVRSNFYDNWAASNSFAVGDILTFNFETNEHDVLRVPKDSYDACSSDNPIGDIITTGPANVSLTTAGDHYYICTVGRHCLAGQKLAITVSSTPGAPSPRSTPRTTPTTPSPAGDDACAPTPVGSPPGTSANGPLGSPPGTSANGPSVSVQPPPPPSSSAAVGANLWITFLAVTVIGWFA